MMMLSQCVTFGTVSEAFFEHWRIKLPVEKESVGKSPATVSACDWREVTDMLDFQAFVATIKVKDDLPDVSATGIPLSVIIAAHHNLVTYGVPFVNQDGQWTNPGPRKTFYVPEEVINMITTKLDQMSRDETIQKWLLTNPNLDGGDVPGMAKWVHTVKTAFYDEPWQMEQKKQWLQFHELSNEVPGETSVEVLEGLKKAWAKQAKQKAAPQHKTTLESEIWRENQS